jgi:erythromycin esterase
VSGADAVSEIRSLARPLTPTTSTPWWPRWVPPCASFQASHAIHEYHQWRALVSRRLIEELSFTWSGVEGDWPDRWRITCLVRGQGDQDLDAYGLRARFERCPMWMWANQEAAEFLTWLRQQNVARPVIGRA